MPLDVLIILAFILYSVSAGFASRKKASESLEEYFLAGRSLKGWQAGFSMAATQFAADTPLLVTGLVATAGIFSLWRLWVYAIAFLALGFFFSGCWRRSGVLTDAEFTELRYSGRGAALLRALKALHLGTLFNCCVLAMVLLAAVRIAEPFLLWHEWLPAPVIHGLADFMRAAGMNFSSVPVTHANVWVLSAGNLISILAILSFTTLYSTTGGLRGVVATDVVQFTIAMVATAAYAWIIIGKAGGDTGIVEKLGTLYGESARDGRLSFAPAHWNSGVYVLSAVMMVQWFAQVNSDGTGYLAQRCMACESDAAAKRAALFFTVAQVVVRSLLWIPIALGLLVLYPAESLPSLGAASETFRAAREATFAFGIRDYLPEGVRGLMLCGMLAALASTIDTHLNWGASYWTNDLYKRFIAPGLFKHEPSSRELVWVARLSNLGLIAVSLFIMSRLSSIQDAWQISLLFGSGLGLVLILRWLWYRINIYSEYAAALSSLVTAFVLLTRYPEMDEGARLLITLAVSTICLLSATLATKPEPEEKLIAFYRKVRPPGFWGPVVKAAEIGQDDPRREFWKMTRATALSSLTVFASLIFFGWWLIRLI